MRLDDVRRKPQRRGQVLVDVGDPVERGAGGARVGRNEHRRGLIVGQQRVGQQIGGAGNPWIGREQRNRLAPPQCGDRLRLVRAKRLAHQCKPGLR